MTSTLTTTLTSIASPTTGGFEWHPETLTLTYIVVPNSSVPAAISTTSSTAYTSSSLLKQTAPRLRPGPMVGVLIAGIAAGILVTLAVLFLLRRRRSRSQNRIRADTGPSSLPSDGVKWIAS